MRVIRFNTQHKFSGSSSQLLETLIQTKDKRISDLVLMFAFSNLLLIPKKPIEFIEHGGLDMIRMILERSENKIKTNYYGLLCYWILSYEEKFVSYAALPSVWCFSYFLWFFFYFLELMMKKSYSFEFTYFLIFRLDFSLSSLIWSKKQEERK